MHRILADVTDEQLRGLEDLARIGAVSRAEVIRRAISAYVGENRLTPAEFFGAWRAGAHPVEDGVEFQESLRAEW